METILARYDAIEPVRTRSSAALDVLAVAGLMAVAAQARLPLPFSPVPVTLQTFVALTAAFLVGRHRAAAGIALYLTLGVAGTPLFAAHSMATVGYLAAFVLAPYIVTRFRAPLAGMIAASLCVYILGATWLVLFLGMAPLHACAVGVLPFLPGDALKVIAAVKVADLARS
ncbi:MAG TPA: biotin transporter BioY [Candidatus Hydrogenedentes bacterium]|nr:biotin transporter BioY [Candidatus Hydrogenedentota bacterium]